MRQHPNDPGIPAFQPPARLRLLVADDNPVVRAGLTALLTDRADTTVVAQAADGREAYEAALRHHPDVILLDVRMPGVDGISALPHLARLAPVMMLTYSHEAETVREALRLGAGGYLVHGEFGTEQLVRAVRDVHEGRPHVTPGRHGPWWTHCGRVQLHTQTLNSPPQKAKIPPLLLHNCNPLWDSRSARGSG